MLGSIDKMIKQLQIGTAKQREDAARVLGESGNNQAIEPLKHALHDLDHYVRNAAAEALAKYGLSLTPSPPDLGRTPKEYQRIREESDRKNIEDLIRSALRLSKAKECKERSIGNTATETNTKFVDGELALFSSIAVDGNFILAGVFAKHRGKDVFVSGVNYNSLFIRGEWENQLKVLVERLKTGQSDGSA